MEKSARKRWMTSFRRCARLWRRLKSVRVFLNVFICTGCLDHLRKHRKLQEAEMKRKAVALELKRERVGNG